MSQRRIALRIPDNTTDCTMTVTFSPTRPGLDFATLIVKSALGATSHFGLERCGRGRVRGVWILAWQRRFGTGYNSPVGIALDAAGNAYVADTGNDVVIHYNSAGIGTVIAGTAGTAGNGGNGGASDVGNSFSTVGRHSNARWSSLYRRHRQQRRPSHRSVTGVINIAAGGASTTCAAALDTFGNGCLGTQAKLSVSCRSYLRLQGECLHLPIQATTPFAN